MAFTSDLLAITLRWLWLGQQMQTKRYFRAAGAAFLTASPENVGEAYWNHVKAAWRALPVSSMTNVFQSVLVEEIGGGLSFGEYAVPSGEKGGTRAAGSLGDVLPSFNNVGVRFTVATRATRPGQMRIPFMYDGDTDAQGVAAPFVALVNTLANLYKADMVLGAPVATGVLRMQVVKFTNTVPAAVAARQDVVGQVINGNVTSQVSRKAGRGT